MHKLHLNQRVTPRKWRRERGQSIIEFALIVPMLFLMLVGVVFIAQGFNLQLVLAGAAYEGAKTWAKGQPGSGFNNCTPPLCDATSGAETLNFEAYVVTNVRRYLNNNGFDGNEVSFFVYEGKTIEAFKQKLQLYDNDREKVELILYYPYRLPIGNFASGFKEIWVGARCVMKRGS